MEDAKNQYTVWKKKDKCTKLQKKFGGYDDFETNPRGNDYIANRQSVYFCVKDLLIEDSYTLLEVGPGPGHFLWALKGVAADVYGLEYSEEMIKLCEDQFSKSDKEVHLTQGSCWDLPYPDKSFDVSMQCDVTRHVGGCWASILEQIRVSRKYVVYSGPSFEKWGDGEPSEKELKPLMFGLNVNFLNKELNKLKELGEIKNYYYKNRPNKKNNRIERKILVIEL